MAFPFTISHQDSDPQWVERSNVIEIFPVKIGSYIFPCEHKTRLKQLCFDIIDKYKNNREYSHQNSDTGDTLTHYFDQENLVSPLLDYPGFETFNSWIKRCSIDYIHNTLECNCDNVVIAQCWINDCSKGGSQQPHIHANSLNVIIQRVLMILMFQLNNMKGTYYYGNHTIHTNIIQIIPINVLVFLSMLYQKHYLVFMVLN